MSMLPYTVVDYGLLLDDEMLQAIKENIGEDARERFIDDNVRVYYGFTGTSSPIRDYGFPDVIDEMTYDFEVVCLLQLDHEPNYFKASYRDLDDMEREMRRQLAGILPDDYPIQENLVQLLGIVDG